MRCDGREELLCGLDIDLLAPLADVDWVKATRDALASGILLDESK